MKNLVDLHCHLTNQEELLAWREFFAQLPPDYDYKVLLAAVNSDQAAWLFPAIKQDPILHKYLIPMAGLHPWQAGLGRAEVDRLRPYLDQSPIVGEIGLDKPWCSVPFAQQVEVLKYQLQVAQDLGKPILLHSKGYERELLDLISAYPYPVIVHWYSCADPGLLQAYIERGCHFTLSTDQGRDPGTRLLWQLVPLDHVHLETDGYEAVVWAQEQFASESSVLAQFASEQALAQFASAPSQPLIAPASSQSQPDYMPSHLQLDPALPLPKPDSAAAQTKFDFAPDQALFEDLTRNPSGISAAQTGDPTAKTGSSIPAALFYALQNSVKIYATLHKLSPEQAEDLFYRNSMDLLGDK